MLCYSHVHRLPPSHLSLRHKICRSFVTSCPWCFRQPDTSFGTNASPNHTEQWQHRVMRRICQWGMLQPPNKYFLSQEAVSYYSCHGIIRFTWKHFQCVSKTTLSICFPAPSTILPSFASCHQSSEPSELFTELSNRCDMFWLSMELSSVPAGTKTEKLVLLSSSVAIDLYWG